jgi:very-short-patch-repair endonuclease
MGLPDRHQRKLRANRFMATRHGVATRGELLNILTPDEIRHLVESGSLEPIHRGVYRATAVQHSWLQTGLAAVLRAPGRTWLSHRSAAYAWKLNGIDAPSNIEVRTTAAVRSTSAIKVYRTDSIVACDQRVIQGIPTMGIERTLLDLAAVAPEVAEDALDDALRRRLTGCNKIRWRMDRLGRQGRAGSRVLGKLLDDRPDGKARFGSGFERRLFAALKTERVPLPETQVVIRDGNRFVAQVDFAYPDQRLIIEAQSYRWHVGKKPWIRDVNRFNDLAVQGWRIIQVRWHELIDAPHVVVERIRRALGIEALTLDGL